MKSYYDTPLPQKPAFVPKTICITCETQDELDALGTLFSHARLLDSLQRASGVRLNLSGTFIQAGAIVHDNIPKLTASISKVF